jgi:hypothetical protein
MTGNLPAAAVREAFMLAEDAFFRPSCPLNGSWKRRNLSTKSKDNEEHRHDRDKALQEKPLGPTIQSAKDSVRIVRDSLLP